MAKILLLTNTFFPDYGAAANRLTAMSINLGKKGNEVLIFANHSANEPNFRFESNIEINRFWGWNYKGRSKLLRLISMCSLAISMLFGWRKAKRFAPELLIVQMPPLALPILANFFKSQLKCRLILTVSDLWPEGMNGLGVLKPTSYFYKKLNSLTERLYIKSDGVLAQSEEIKEKIEKFCPGTVALYRTGADGSLFKPKSDYALKKKPLIIYAGMLGIAQGVLGLCKNLPLVELEAELLIAGDGIEKKAVEDISKANPSIKYLGAFPHQEIPGLLKTADLTIISQSKTLQGTVPTKLYEAMAVGLPVLFIGKGEGEKIITSSGCGFSINPGDVKDLTLKVKEILSYSDAQREELGKKGRKYFEKHFDRPIQFKALDQLISSLIKL